MIQASASGGERQEEMGIDRQLRAHGGHERERGLPDRFARAARRRHREADPRGSRVDLRDVHAKGPRGVLAPLDQGDADVGRRAARIGPGRGGRQQHGDERADDPPPADPWILCSHFCLLPSASAFAGCLPEEPFEVPSEDGSLRRLADPDVRQHPPLPFLDGAMPSTRKKDESVPKSSRSGPTTASADSNTCSRVSPGAYFSHPFELDVSKYVRAHVREHQRLAEHPGAEVRDDDGE